MNKTLQTILIVAAVLIGVVVLVGAGFFLGRTSWNWTAYQPGGMMGAFNRDSQDYAYGYGMMDNRSGYGMMDNYNGYGMMGRNGGYGMMGNYNGYGMMEGYGGYGMMEGYGGYGMMGTYGTSADVEPLSADASLDAVEAYLSTLNNDDLVVEEIMVFDNNSYAIVKEESTGISAFELLVDPTTQSVFPEFGPNMMWNLKYGMHADGQYGPGMMGGGMMGGYNYNNYAPSDVSADMTVSEEEALQYAQAYLDANQPGVTVSDEITAFYGYYTIDLEQDGEIVGMLSVNGFSGQVFPHTWHGDFIEMTEFGHD